MRFLKLRCLMGWLSKAEFSGSSCGRLWRADLRFVRDSGVVGKWVLCPRSRFGLVWGCAAATR